MDTGSDANGGNDAGSEKGTSVDGGPLEENGTHGASPASESRASGPEPSSGSPGRLSRHKKTSPPSKTGGRGWMPPPLKKFFSSDSWFGKKSETLEYGKMPLEEKRKHYTCGKDYLTTADIPTWADFHKTIQYPKDLKELQCTVNPALNEKVSVWRGDITHLEIDAIVNAANCSLLGGGGVDGAIHRAASRALLRECEGLGGCDTGDAKLTGGHRLPAKYVLHTVGPTDRDPAMLESCYNRCLELVLEHSIKSVAFPCIATGVYGYPHKDAALLALKATREWLEEHSDKVDRIIFCVFLEVDYKLYCKYLHYFYPVEKPDTQEIGSSDVEEPFKPSMKYSVSAPAEASTKLQKAAPPPEPLEPTVSPPTTTTISEAGADIEMVTEEEEEGEEKEGSPSVPDPGAGVGGDEGRREERALEGRDEGDKEVASLTPSKDTAGDTP